MYLHEDQDIFIDAIQKTREETGIEPAIIEKDYYVSMMLSLLAALKIPIIYITPFTKKWALAKIKYV